MLPRNKKLKEYSGKLRNNMTEAERRLWSAVRMKQLDGRQFYRQRIIGNYIVYFYCPKCKLVVELDGGQNYSEDGIKNDRQRDEHLTNLGLKVLRFSDRDVFKNFGGVLEEIYRHL